MSGKRRPPKRGKDDIAHAGARALLSTIPLVGGAAVELFQFVVTPPLEKRRDEWMEEVGKSLADLEATRDTNLEKLQNDDTFIDVALIATQIALRNSQAEKLRALRNAVLNAALPSPPDRSLQEMFLAFVDIFTVWHIRLLSLFANQNEWANKTGKTLPGLYPGGVYIFIESVFPDLEGRQSFYEQIWRDLHIRGLVTPESLQSLDISEAFAPRRVSDLGRKFLKFISEPDRE